jgi:IrrE N-terminal-like domain
MKVTRLDLDGTGSPEGLVTKILKAEPQLSYPVPIEELARALDILEIAELPGGSVEGSLVMDECRGNGIILVNKSANAGRRRFTIGHELGHFLIPTHMPVKGDRFLCSREDMQKWSISEQSRYDRMETEANRFSALILMPPPLLRKYMAQFREPDLAQVLALHRDFDVSKDAAARAFATYHNDLVAVAVVKDSKVQRFYRMPKFPRLAVESGHAVPRSSIHHQLLTRLSKIAETDAGQWLASDWGKALPTLYEQVLHQQNGYALILLWAEVDDRDEVQDEDESRTSSQRLAARRNQH